MHNQESTQPTASATTTASPGAFTLETADGFPIKGCCWRHPSTDFPPRPVVIINPATSVVCRYYFRFAAFLFRHGFDVIAYDYRGIGGSRPARLRGFEASWVDWGYLDFDAIVRYAARSFPGQPIDVVAHSAGGFVLGFAKSNYLIRRIFTVGAQYAYWRDYATHSRLRMFAKWHIAMPLLTTVFGYFPAKRLGWMEDTPKGVVREWANSRARFENSWSGLSAARYEDKQALVQQFGEINAPILAVGIADDEFGTVPAVERLLAYFTRSSRMHLRISPESIQEPEIGHFGFFNSRFEPKLWPLPLRWLKAGVIPEGFPGIQKHFMPKPDLALSSK